MIFSTLHRAAQRLEALGVDWVLGGSVAAMLVGEARYTQDIDIVAVLDVAHVDGLKRAFADGYYFDPVTARDAIEGARSFNVIDLETGIKLDVFAHDGGVLERLRWERRQAITVSDEATGEPFDVWIGTPEDQILRKLEWFRRGGGVAGQQLRDVAGIAAVSGELDREYLDRVADEVGLFDELRQALGDAGST